ncbi:Dynamin-binding protein, partial [Lachnellula willkommii]
MPLSSAKSSPALNGMPKTGKSVKDLLKRFDQNNEPSSSTVRKPAPRLVTKDGASGPPYMRDRSGNVGRTTGVSQNTSTSSRAGTSTRDGVGRKSPEKTRTTQRTRFATEDQDSNNILSGVPRSTRTRNPVSGSSSQASKSMINLSPTSPTSPNSNLLPQTPARRPLFGEVLPVGPGSDDIGYGIPHAATRRTSDSNLHPNWQRQRSRSEVDVSPSSPTAWYLGVTHTLDDVEPNRQPRSLHGHNRNHSDFADPKANPMNGVNPDFESSVMPSLPKPSKRQASRSRLPKPSKRLSNSSESSSPTSTRASSPFTSYSNVKFRKPEQRPWSPATRDLTNTPTQRSARGKATRTEPAPNGASLKAYISAPPPTASPPLRSSRPRQSVSVSTNNLKQKAGSSHQVPTGMKITRSNGRSGFGDPQPRKMNVGPVDYAEARNMIKRAYTKSINEKEKNKICAENRRRLLEKPTQDSVEADNKDSNAPQSRPETPPPPVLAIDHQPNLGSSPPPLQTSPQPLQISTSFFDDPSPLERNMIEFQDSPTLGMPGSFVDDEEPPRSAVSNTTASTEIENEPQTEVARLRRLPSTTKREASRLSYNVLFVSDDLSPEQALYGMGQDELIDVKLASTPVEEAEPTPTKDVVTRYPSPPGAFHNDLDDEPVSEINLTNTNLDAISAAPLRPAPIPESADEQGSSEPEHPKEPTVADEPTLPRVQGPPEIYLPDEAEFTSVNDKADAPRLQLPDLRTALAPPSVTSNEGGNDYLNTPVTDMDYESSDGAGATNLGEQAYQTAYETRRDPIPSLRGHRSSHQSSWTDYSIDSTQESAEPVEGQKSPPPLSVFNIDRRAISPAVPPKPEGYSPQPSPRFSVASPSVGSPNYAHSPAFGADDGFGFGFMEPITSIPLWPEYAPPPVPQQPMSLPPNHDLPPATHNEPPRSSVDHSSHNDASQSRRPSDDVYSTRPSMSTPRSSRQVSTEDVFGNAAVGKKHAIPETQSEREASEVLAKRLFQRKKVMEELVSTESNYLKDLNVAEEIYKGTAEACPKLEPGDIKTLFRNTDEIIAFTTTFLDDLKTAAAPILPQRAPKWRGSKAGSIGSPTTTASDRFSVAATLDDLSDEQKDQRTSVGACFGSHLKKLQAVYSDFLKNQEAASSRLKVLEQDPSVNVWLDECNTVAKDLTLAWNLDALLVKPVQRLTRYQLFLVQLLKETDADHPDYPALTAASSDLAQIINNINELKRRITMVTDIVGRKRKESNVRKIGRVWPKGVKKEKDDSPNQLVVTRTEDDPVYLKLHEKYCDNYLRMQVVLRDVEFHVRQCITNVNDDLRYKSAMELVMRLSASPWPEIESKWARFNMSMRDMGTVALDEHTGAIRTQVIEPFEKTIQLYGPPGLAMKKRTKRRAEYEKIFAAKKSGSKITEKDQTKLDQYEALNETLKLELPKLFEKTEEIANLLLGHFIVIQTRWYDVWQKKVRVVLEESQIPKDIPQIVDTFNRDYKFVESKAQELGIINGTINLEERVPSSGKASTDTNDVRSRKHSERKPRPSDLSSRSRGISMTSDHSPSLPTPDFAKRLSGSQFTFSPISSTTPNIPQFAYQGQSYQGQPYSTSHSRQGSGSPATPDARQHGQSLGRPSTSRSFTSDNGGMRMSNDYNTQYRRESGSTSYSHHQDGPPISSRPYSGIFHSAMPLPDGPEDSARSSRASSRDRNFGGGYNVLYLAASLFEFNIAATKSEAGYPYLTYQAGEIFDVIGEKGELWLAKNQDDLSEQVGWIW